MEIYLSTISIEGSILKGENPLPIFRDREKDKPIQTDGTLNKESMENMGYEIGMRILPYKLQDRYDRERKIVELKTVVIKNDKLKAVFLCEYGGRLYSLSDLETGKELLFKNPVFQLANLSARNSWFSGGIEWNVSQFGHSLQTCEPLFFAIVHGEEDFLRMYEFERTKRIYYQIDFRLPEGSKNLYAHIKIINDENYKKPMYWWTNIAVREEKNIRIFSSTEDIVYIYPDSVGSTGNSLKKFGASKLPKTPFVDDGSYPLNFPYSSEYFFQTKKETLNPWEATLYNDGFIFFEMSTNKLRYRKMFCWGNLEGGRKWESFLSKENEGAYVEIQAGITPTQVNGFDIDANSCIEFTQMFSFINLINQNDINELYDKDYSKAREKIQNIIDNNVGKNHLDDLFYKYSKESNLEINGELLFFGKGWGALEDKRREKYKLKKSPKSLSFPKSSINKECLIWLKLLEYENLDEMEESYLPDSYMLDLKNELENIENKNAITLIHLGIIYYENFLEEKAFECWIKSLNIKPYALAYRNLSIYYKNKNEYDKSIFYMEKALCIFESKNKFIDEAFLVEYLELLSYVKNYDKIISIYEKYNKNEKISKFAAKAYLEKKEYKKLENIFNIEQITIREGENYLLDIYFEYIAKLKSEKENIEFNSELVKKVRAEEKAPKNLDFRMVKR